MSAQVGEFQHALAWNRSQSAGDFYRQRQRALALDRCHRRNRSGVLGDGFRHFQNLNGSLGSLAEVVSMSPLVTSPYSMMAGLGVNGTAGVKSSVRDRGLASDSFRLRRPGGDRSHEQQQLVREQRAGSRHLFVLAKRSLHAGRIWRQPRGHRCGCGRRRRHHAHAGAVSGGPARPDAVAHWNLPRVARSRGRQLEREQRHQPHPRQRRNKCRLQRRRAHPLHGRHAARVRRRNHLSGHVRLRE